MASIPSYRLSVHVRRLVAAGHAVGVCTQADPLKGGQPYARALAAVYSPATLLDDDLIGDDSGGGSGGGSKTDTSSSSSSSTSSGNILKFFNGKPQFARKKTQEVSGEGDEDGGASDDDDGIEEGFSAHHNEDSTSQGGPNNDVDDVESSGADGAERWLVCLLDLPASHAAVAKAALTSAAEVGDRDESPNTSTPRTETSSSFASRDLHANDACDEDACLALVACDLQAGRLVHSSWLDGPHRLGLAERLAQLNPVELLLPAAATAADGNTGRSWQSSIGSSSSPGSVGRESVVDGIGSATELCVQAFAESAVDATGRPRIVRVARLPSQSFELDTARTALRDVLLGSAMPSFPSLLSASTSTSSSQSPSTPLASSFSAFSSSSSSSSFASPVPTLRSPATLSPEAQSASARCWAAARNLPEPLERCLGALLGYLRPLGLDRVLLAAGDTGTQELIGGSEEEEEEIMGEENDARGIEARGEAERHEQTKSKKRPRETVRPSHETTGLVLESLDALSGTGSAFSASGGVGSAGGRMHLPASTVRDLELFAALRDKNNGHRGSLFWHLNRCATPSGARQLKRWLGAPLTDANAIAARLDAVGCLAGHSAPNLVPPSADSATSPLTASSYSSSGISSDKNSRGTNEVAPACLNPVLQALRELGRKRRGRPSSSSQSSGSSDRNVATSAVGGLDLESATALLHYRRLSPTKLWKLLEAARYAVTSLPSLPQLTSQVAMRSSLLVSVLRPACMRSNVLLQRLAAVAALVDPAAGDDKARALRGSTYDKDTVSSSSADNSGSADGTGYSSHGSDVGSDSKALAAALVTALAPLKEARRQEQLAVNTLENLLPALREASGQPKLQFKHMRSGATGMLEYLVELPVSYTSASGGGGKVPEGWTPVNRTQQVVRYLGGAPVTEGLKHLEVCRDAVTAAGARAWTMVLATADDYLFGDLKNLVASLSTLDALKSLSMVAQLPGYTRPSFEASDGDSSSRNSSSTGTKRSRDTNSDTLSDWLGGTLVAVEARHPTIERVLEETSATVMVPNDFVLGRGGQSRSATVVTGPNMGGKSLYVRTVSLLVVLAQIGSYVPAKSLHFGGGPFDGVFTRMGADDDIARGKSTFLVELNATAFILKHATAKSLVVLDELGRGTATHDGAAIAHATLYYLAFNTKCATLFVTHYNNIADLAESESTSESASSSLSSSSSSSPTASSPSLPTQLPSPWAATGPPIQSQGIIVNVFMDFLIDDQSNSSSSHPPPSNTSATTSSSSRLLTSSAPSSLLADVTFLYRAVEGRASASHGLNVARLAGLPHNVLQEAAARAQEAQATEASWRLSKTEGK